MACLGVLGCKNNTHRSAGSYALTVLAILGIGLAVRVLLYALARWLQRWQRQRTALEEDEEEEDAPASAAAAAATGGAAVEMQGWQQSGVSYVDAQRQRCSRRKSHAAYSRPPPELAASVRRHGRRGATS